MEDVTRLSPLQGIVPPLITPLRDQRELDHQGLERLIEHVLGGGVHGLFLLGTTGEGPSLPYRVRHQLTEVACEIVAGRVPVLVGITDTSTEESCELAERAAQAGAAGLVLAPPYYWPMAQSELIGYVLRLVERLPLPLLLYNMPGCTKTWFEPDTVRQLLAHPRVVGLKDSSGDLDYLRTTVALCDDLRDVSFLVGPEELLPEAMVCGAIGGVHGGANLFPGLYVQLYESICRADVERAAVLHDQVLQIARTIYSLSKPPSRIIKGLKAALQVAGICSGLVAEPFSCYTDADRDQIACMVQRRQRELERLCVHTNLQVTQSDRF